MVHLSKFITRPLNSDVRYFSQPIGQKRSVGNDWFCQFMIIVFWGSILVRTAEFRYKYFLECCIFHNLVN